MVKKISISIDENLYNEIQEQCKESKQKVSQFISLSCEHELATIKGEKDLKDLFNIDTGQVLEAFETIHNIKSLLDNSNKE